MNEKTPEIKKTTIGGQAIIEGIMMKGPSKLAMAVRKPDGEIVLEVEELEPVGKKHPWMAWPIIRGAVGLVQAMKIGMRAIMFSSSFYEEEEEEQETWLNRKFGDKAEDIGNTLMIITSILLAVGIFMVLPNLLTSLIVKESVSAVGKNLIEGVFRLFFFFIYVLAIARVDDVKRIFEYHGAEHKTISCYEHGEELTVANVKKYSPLHPRCGTSFLFMVMIVSILVLSLFGWPNPWVRLATRILMLPVIAGITYEINRWIGGSDSPLVCKLAYPGLMVQKYATVREPDDSMIEVAIESLNAVLPKEGEDDSW